jgi:hypothetical protein
MERLKPLNDYIFKKLFGENEVKDNLVAFLNAVLDRKDRDRLVTLEIVDNKELTREKSLHERANMISSAKEEGIKEGIIATAKNLLVMGMDVEMVSKATGLTIENVKSLKH